MGASNVKKAFAYWSHLDHREMRALVFMANISLDADAPPVYFGGWEALSAALGADPDGNPQSARRTAVRVLGALAKTGVIVSSGQARTGVRAEYALALDPKVTFKPIGEGRNVSWEQVRITTMTETVTGTQKAEFTPPFTLSVTPAGVLSEGSVETARGTQGETARGTQGETARGTQGETARVPDLRQLRVPQGTTSGTTEEYLEEKLEEQPIVDTFDSPARENENDDEKTWLEEEPLTQEQERQRQMRELQKRMEAEGEAS